MFSRKIFYAVEAVLYIAYNGASDPVSSKEIAEKQNLPPRYLEQIMQRLVRAGILRGIRGPKGGYLLARERRRISVGDICAVLREDEQQDDNVTSTPLGAQVIEPIWNSLSQTALESLNQMSMADLCEQARAKNIRKAADERMDFAI